MKTLKRIQTSNTEKSKKMVVRKEKFKKIPSVLIAQYAYKIGAYLNDINQSLLKANALGKLAENDPSVIGDFDLDKAGNFLAKQHEEAIKMYNELNVELEARAKDDIKFDFNYYHSNQHAKGIDDLYNEYARRMQATREQPPQQPNNGIIE